MLKEIFLNHIPDNLSDETFKKLIEIYFKYISPQLSMLDNQVKTIDIDFIEKLKLQYPSLVDSLDNLKSNITEDCFSMANKIFEKASKNPLVLKELKDYLIALGTTPSDLNDLLVNNYFSKNINQSFRESARDFNLKKGTLSGFLGAKLLQDVSSDINFKNDIILDYMEISEGENIIIPCDTTLGSNIVTTPDTSKLYVDSISYEPSAFFPAGTKVTRILSDTEFEVLIEPLEVIDFSTSNHTAFLKFKKRDYPPFLKGSIINFVIEKIEKNLNSEDYSLITEVNSIYDNYNLVTDSLSLASSYGTLLGDGEIITVTYQLSLTIIECTNESLIFEYNDGDYLPEIGDVLNFGFSNNSNILVNFLNKVPFVYQVNTSILRNLFNNTIKELAHPVGFDILFVRLIKLLFTEQYSFLIENYVKTLKLSCWNLATGVSSSTNLLLNYEPESLAQVYTSDTQTRIEIDVKDKATGEKFTFISDFDRKVYKYSKEIMYFSSIKLIDKTLGKLSPIFDIDNPNKITGINYQHLISSVKSYGQTYGTAYVSDFTIVDRFYVGGSVSLIEDTLPRTVYLNFEYTINEDYNTIFRGILPLNLYSGDNSVDEVNGTLYFENRFYSSTEMQYYFDNNGVLLESFTDNCRLIYEEGETYTQIFKETQFKKDIVNFLNESYPSIQEQLKKKDIKYISETYDITEILSNFLIKYSSNDTYNNISETNFLLQLKNLGNETYDFNESLNKKDICLFSDTVNNISESLIFNMFSILNDNLNFSVDTSSILHTSGFSETYDFNDVIPEYMRPIIGPNLIINQFVIGFDGFSIGMYRNGIYLRDNNYSVL